MVEFQVPEIRELHTMEEVRSRRRHALPRRAAHARRPAFGRQPAHAGHRVPSRRRRSLGNVGGERHVALHGRLMGLLQNCPGLRRFVRQAR